MTNLVQLENIDLLNSDFKTLLEQSEEFQELSTKIDLAIAESSDIVVVTENDVSQASHYLANFKSLAKDLDNHRLSITRPLDEKKKEIKNTFDKIIIRFDEETKRLQSEILTFKKKRDEEIRRKAEEERKKREEEALNAAIEAGVEEPDIVSEVVTEKVKISSLNSSGVQTRRYKKWEITDMVKFVRSLTDEQIETLLEVNSVGMNAYRGTFDVEDESKLPGVRFYYEEKV